MFERLELCLSKFAMEADALHVLDDKAVVATLTAAARGMTVGPGELNPEWLAARGFVVLPQESGGHLTREQCTRLAIALSSLGTENEFAVATEPLHVGPLAYELAVTVDDLSSFSHECGPYNFVLFPPGEPTHAVLFSTNDYLLFAGPEALVSSFAGDLTSARSSFLSFVNDNFEVMQPALRPLERYLDWIDA